MLLFNRKSRKLQCFERTENNMYNKINGKTLYRVFLEGEEVFSKELSLKIIKSTYYYLKKVDEKQNIVYYESVPEEIHKLRGF